MYDLIKVQVHLKTVELNDNQDITHNKSNNKDQPEYSSSTIDFTDVLKHFLKNKDNRNDFQLNQMKIH